MNLHDFTEEILRLLSLSRKNSDRQSQPFIDSVEYILPKRVLEKLLDFLDSYEIIHKGKYPELPTLVDFIYKYCQEIDAHISLQSTVYILQSTVYRLQSTVYDLQSILYTCRLFTLYSTL